MTIKQELETIFVMKYLKTHPGVTEREIVEAYIRDGVEQPGYAVFIGKGIDYLKEKNAITIDDAGKIRYHQVLDPLPKRLVGFIEVNPLMEEGAVSTENLVTPTDYKNPDIKDLAQRIQGDRGTCVGQACANVKDLTSIPFDRPDNLDKEGYRRDIKDPDGLIHDNLYYTSASAECAYQISRRLGNITAPSGSYTYLGMKALTGGVCFEDEWPTSKTPYMTLPLPRPDMKDAVNVSTANHKIDGYATLYPLTFENCKAAIYKYHTVAGSFDIYENYGSMMGGDGTLPEPKGDVVGGHALCLYGYDVDYLYCIHTWGDWCGRFGRISKHYFDVCCNDIFCPIETAEMERLKEAYAKITCLSNMRTNFYLIQTGEKKYIGTYPDTPVTLQLRIGVPVVFYSEAVEHNNLNLTTEYTPRGEGLFVVNFDIPSPNTGFWAAFLSWLQRVFHK
jgi:hypothetical protein